MALKRLAFLVAAGNLALTLAGCSQQADLAATAGESPSDTLASAAFAQFPDIPTPAGSKLVVDRTLALGSGDSWIGQIVINTTHDSFSMFNFLKARMPEFGWTEVTSVRAQVSVLTYSRQGRVASIQIQSRTVNGSEVLVTVSPAEGPGSSGGPGVPAPVRSAPAGRPTR
jgi:hypothetical protein